MFLNKQQIAELNKKVKLFDLEKTMRIEDNLSNLNRLVETNIKSIETLFDKFGNIKEKVVEKQFLSKKYCPEDN